MKRFVVGDLHGAHKALVQCLQRSKFNPETDLLISLGDICDGWPEVNKVIDELLRIKNLKVILGNHDAWTLRGNLGARIERSFKLVAPDL